MDIPVNRSPAPDEEKKELPEQTEQTTATLPAQEDTAPDETIPPEPSPKGKRWFRRLWRYLKPVIAVLGVLALILLGVDRYVVETTRADICPVDALPEDPADAILVLGAYVHEDGRLSDMLLDRVKVGISLYKAGAGKVLLLSGDSRTPDYDETTAMKAYAVEQGVPEEAIVVDKAGLSTYESVYRADKVGGYRSLIIVSQTYHLYRALYIAQAVGVDAIGVSADLRYYWGQTKREVREVLARNKDVIQCWQLPTPAPAENAWVSHQ